MVVGSQNKTVYCFNATTGDILWKYKALGKVDASPVIAGKTVVVASADGRIRILDLITGAMEWNYEIGSPVYSTPAVTSAGIAVGADDGNIYFFWKMKIVHIVPGFGGTFYCGNCLRDSALVASLRKEGHDTVILPVYLPLVMNGAVVPDGPPVFYGAVSIYLKQQFPSLRRMPSWLHSLLNSTPVLNYAAGKAGSTRAHGLEALTESMLLGEDGLQADDLKEMVTYLRDHEKPDIVHLSNALLLGMAGMIRKEVGVPVVCTLQDEDVWIDVMEPEAREKLWH